MNTTQVMTLCLLAFASKRAMVDSQVTLRLQVPRKQTYEEVFLTFAVIINITVVYMNFTIAS